MKIVLLVIIISVLLGLFFFKLAIQILIKKGRKFPVFHFKGYKPSRTTNTTLSQKGIKTRKVKNKVITRIKN